jgi:serine/threonine-protein kinase ATR
MVRGEEALLRVVVGLFALFVFFFSLCAGAADAPPRPVMRDFMGLNVHTVQFKPALYAPVCRLLRDYHPMEWDVGKDTSHVTTFPLAINRVDWNELYGKWSKAGYEVDACVMFDGLPADKWKDAAGDARAYGEAFAKYFGPSHQAIVTSAEIGNEPAKYSEKVYRTIFENMARGMRAGDAKLKIATCAVMTGKPDQWSKPVAAIAGLEELYDVVNVHSYPFKEHWPTWRRSYPEDPGIAFLKEIQSVIDWRNEHAAGKQVWLTEFGYDSSTKKPAKEGPWKDWVGVSDEQQAQYTVRSFLVLSAMDLDRAYLYFFNDKDEPQLHGASGITRDFKPKPAFYAMAYLYKTLGDYRFARAISKTGDLYCFEYDNASKANEKIYVAWSPTAGEPQSKVLPITAQIVRAEKMPLSSGDAATLKTSSVQGGIQTEITQSPIFIFVH